MLRALIALLLTAAPSLAAVTFTLDAPIGRELNLPVCSWIDSSQPTKAIIVAIHGATLYSRTFDQTARHLAARGYPVYAADMRGFGRWQDESAKFFGDSGIHYCQSKEDLLLILNRLRQEFPDRGIYCLGESIGANICFWLASSKPDFIDGMIVSSPCIKPICHPTPRLALDLTKGFFQPNKRVQLRPHLAPWLSDDVRVTEAYENDPEILHGLSAIELIKSMKTNRLALLEVKSIPAELPVLILAGKKDEVYSAKAIPVLAKEIGSQRQTIVIAPNKGHLLLETNYVEPDILGTIDDWLGKNTMSTEQISQAR